jgi:hypothetical protein
MAAPSWLSKVGQVIAKILGIAQKAEPTAVELAKLVLPQFAPEIGLADGLFNKIVTEIVAAETAAAAAGTATGTGAQKLAAVLAASGPAIDAWVAANFPGSKQVSDVAKSKVISAVVDLLNELSPTPAPPAA